MPLKLCIIHVSRSGSHAVQNWLCHQLPGDVCAHIDWCPRREAGRSVCEYRGDDLTRHGPERNYRPKKKAGANLVVMLENFDLNGWADEGFAGKFDEVRVIARDPYNWLASAYKQFQRHGNQVKYLTVGRPLPVRIGKGFTKWYGATMGGCALWTQHLKHAMGEENLIGQPVKAMDYNRWVADEAYRRQLAEGLGVEKFTDRGFRDIPPHGGGSSWTKRRALRPGSPTLTRYTEFAGFKEFQSLVTPDMVRIGQEFFGMERPW